MANPSTNQTTKRATVKATVKELEIRENPSVRNDVKYFVSITPIDTISVCEKNFYWGIGKGGKAVFFDVKNKYKISKDIFDFLSNHQNSIFKLKIQKVITASAPFLTITSATLIC